MKKTLFEISNRVFYKIAQSTIAQIDFSLSDRIEFPIIENTSKCRITIPKPRKVGDDYFFEGCIFDSYDDCFEIIWSLYLATISQMAAHAKISDYSKYRQWIENKTLEKCWKVIDFVENIRVEEYLRTSFPEVLENVLAVKSTYNKLIEDKILKHTNEKFYNLFYVKKSDKITELREKFSQSHELKINEVIPYLDFLYENQASLSENILPYCIHRNDCFSYKRWNKNMKIRMTGWFETVILELDGVWNKEKNMDDRLDEYQNLAEGSHFDQVIVGSENLAEFSRLSNESAGLLQRLRTSIRTLSNIVDTPAAEDAGIIEMQMAIQREASKNQGIQIFEQDVPRKESENWVVVIDASASMISKFEDMKKMALCLSEAAETINQTGGKWGLYSFNNNFIIVKDHVEHYDQETKARIGGIENKGLSLIPDAVNMGVKILKKDKESTHKYLILISDGHALGYNDIDEDFKKSLLNAKRNSVNVIGVGVPKNMARYFSFIINCDDPKKSVDKFMSAYSYLTQTMK